METTVHQPPEEHEEAGFTSVSQDPTQPENGEPHLQESDPGEDAQDCEALQETAFTGEEPGSAENGEAPEEVEFTDISEGEPAQDAEDGQPPEEGEFIDVSEDDDNPEEQDSQEEDSSSDADKTEEPAVETLSLHVHRTIATGRTVLSVITNSTDPYYRVEPNLDSLADGLPLLQQLYDEAAAHWQDSPRYPASPEHKPKPPARTQPRTDAPNRQQSNASQQQPAQQASLL